MKNNSYIGENFFFSPLKIPAIVTRQFAYGATFFIEIMLMFSRFETRLLFDRFGVFLNFFLISEKFFTKCIFRFFHRYRRFPMQKKNDNTIGRS